MVYDAFGKNVAEYSGSTLEREHIYRGGGLLAIYEAGASALRYVLMDVQGSTRAVLNSNGTVMARHDYLPFGEEIGAGIGLRTSGQGFGASDPNRQKYGLTERDGTTGLDHTLWRKNENLSGRWTSPDPLRGTIAAPQTFNAYTYAANDPVNFVDPSGLNPQDPGTTPHTDPATGRTENVPGIDAGVVTVTFSFQGGTIGGSALGMFESDANQQLAVIQRGLRNTAGLQNLANQDRLPFNTCAEFVNYLVDLAVKSLGNVAQSVTVSNLPQIAMAVGTAMMTTAYLGYESHIDNGADGFKDELTSAGKDTPSGEQGAGVYGHIFFAGGATIFAQGNPAGYAAYFGNKAKDWVQAATGWFGGGDQYASERAGNLAGKAVGQHMWNFISGATPRDPQRLRNSLTSELCR